MGGGAGASFECAGFYSSGWMQARDGNTSLRPKAHDFFPIKINEIFIEIDTKLKSTRDDALPPIRLSSKYYFTFYCCFE